MFFFCFVLSFEFFLLPQNVFISSPVLLGIAFLVDDLFFSTRSQCSLAPMVSCERSAVNLTKEALYVMSLLPCCFQGSLVVFDSQQFDYDISGCDFL